MGHVGDLQRLFRELLFRLFVALLQLRDALLQPLAFLDERGPLLRGELALHPVGVGIARGAQGLQILQKLVALVIVPHDEIRIRRHVSMRDIRPHRLDVVTDEFQIEHAGIIAERAAVAMQPGGYPSKSAAFRAAASTASMTAAVKPAFLQRAHALDGGSGR